MQNNSRIRVGLAACLPDFSDQNVPVGADRPRHICRRFDDMDGKDPVSGARHIVAIASRNTDFINCFPQRHPDGKVSGVGIGILPDAVREIQIQIIVFLLEGNAAFRIIDAEIIRAEFQQPADVKPQIAAFSRSIVHHQRRVIQDARSAGCHAVSIQVGCTVCICYMNRGRFIQQRLVVRRIGAAAQREPKIDGSRIPHTHFQRCTALLQGLQLLRRILLPVDGQSNRFDVLHQVDRPVRCRVIAGVIIGVLRSLRVGRHRAENAKQPKKPYPGKPPNPMHDPFCCFHQQSPIPLPHERMSAFLNPAPLSTDHTADHAAAATKNNSENETKLQINIT